MRRALSILLVLLFGMGPLAATLGAQEDARLPACCRRNGAHHCAMSAETAAIVAAQVSRQASFKAPSTCNQFPGSTDATTSAPQALAASPLSLPALLAGLHTAQASRTSARLAQMRARSSRAPPADLLS